MAALNENFMAVGLYFFHDPFQKCESCNSLQELCNALRNFRAQLCFVKIHSQQKKICAMKNYEVLQKDVQNAAIEGTLMGTQATAATMKSGRHLKQMVYVTGLAGLLFCFNGCFSTGYVTTEPVYVQHSRPAQPSTLHVWVDGDWGWSRPNKNYVQRDGYWTRPAQGRTYVSGSWKATPKGHSWSKGHWRK
jgi:hypothetical protein